MTFFDLWVVQRDRQKVKVHSLGQKMTEHILHICMIVAAELRRKHQKPDMLLCKFTSFGLFGFCFDDNNQSASKVDNDN